MATMMDTIDRNNEDEDFSPSARPTSTSIIMEEDDDADADDADDADAAADDDDGYDPATPSVPRQQRRRSINKSKGRRRRRSSARFLRLTPSEDQDDGLLEGTLTAGEGGSAASSTSAASLGEVYQKAIRMNAENRINAANSWNLSLIDHLDRFIKDDMGPTSGNGNGNGNGNRGGGASFGNAMDGDSLSTTATGGVNFTKASCTLDASVKIYSYRVDDVHLTSYKVLANLNRTDNGKGSGGSNNKTPADADAASHPNADANGDEDDAAHGSKRASNKTASATDTLERNIANINIHKLDAAFDIDPLFHKMSKTFDEGGAKGLLLANLGVSRTGGNIVFDSSLDDEQDRFTAVVEESKEGDEAVPPSTVTTSVDVTSLVNKLEALLSVQGQSIQDVPLVPQLALLRQEFSILHHEGYVEQVGATERYASSHEEEIEADRSIHLEAIERSRASLGRSLLAQEQSYRDGSTRMSLDSNSDQYAPDDYGGGGGDFDDNDEYDAGTGAAGGDGVFGGSMIHDGDHRFSSSSFQAAFIDPRLTQPSQASVLLDAIAAGDIATSQFNNPYEYFNSQALQNLSSVSGNLWAGADHWKKMSSSTVRRRKIVTGKGGSELSSLDSESAKPGGKKKGGKIKTNKIGGDRPALVDITKPVDNLDKHLQMPKKIGKSKTANDPLRFTKATMTKYGKEDNLLPLDAGLGVEQLTTLFLRPSANLAEMAGLPQNWSSPRAAVSTMKTVGFGGVETWGNRSYEDQEDDGGAGFDFGGGGDHCDQDGQEDFVIPDLDDVRKVEKIKVGYATVAKKVDVKRLKQDLWNELDRTFQKQKGNSKDGSTQGEESNEKDVETTTTDESVPSLASDPKEDGPLSFHDTVRDMQATQSQSDVTLSFYFICILHLCNEKGLALESCGLDDFVIHSS